MYRGRLELNNLEHVFFSSYWLKKLCSDFWQCLTEHYALSSSRSCIFASLFNSYAARLYILECNLFIIYFNILIKFKILSELFV